MRSILWTSPCLKAVCLFFCITATTAFCFPRLHLLSPPATYSTSNCQHRIPLYSLTQQSESTSDKRENSSNTVDSSVSDSTNGSSKSSTVQDGAPITSKQPPNHRLELPWNDAQEWALRDTFSKYTVQISANNQETLETHVLWRNLVLDTPELAGYPFPYLVDRLQEATYKPTNWKGEILPYLDTFCFTSNGGISGAVYGIPGVADGTQIQTTPVGNVDVTIPRSFVQTSDGTIYELGQPLDKASSSSVVQTAATQLESRLVGGEKGSATSTRDTEGGGALSVLDPEVINLGALTALVVGSAWAVGALSHHLTVNVFWV